MKLNPNDAPKGFVAVPDEGCYKCGLLGKGLCFKVRCQSGEREDGHSIIFVKRPVKPKKRCRDAERIMWMLAADNPSSPGFTKAETALLYRVARKLAKMQ